MDTRQRNLLIRNGVAGAVLLLLVLVILSFFGVFEGELSDEAQVRALIEASKEEITDHDWDDLLDLTDSPPAERDIWKRTIPKQADLVVIEAITPNGFITVPADAKTYSVEVTVLARLELPIAGGLRAQSIKGRLFFVKVDVRGKQVWKLDLRKSAPTFPYLPNPVMPARQSTEP